MRVNVYTEELLRQVDGMPPAVEIVSADYVSSRTGLPTKNWGLRIYLKSPPDLHYVPGRDDDRSAVTFWCGDSQSGVLAFISQLKSVAEYANMLHHREKVQKAAADAEAALTEQSDT